MVTVLGGPALAKAARAVANGVKLGRKSTLTHHQKQEAIKRIRARKKVLGEIARSYGVSRWTISRLTEGTQ